MPQTWKIDWTVTPDGAVRELVRQGELFLKGTVQLGIAADQRASTLSAIFGGGAIALLAAAAAVISGHPNAALEWSFTVAAIFLFISSFLAAHAAEPVNFFVAGYEPKLLHSSSSDELWMMRYVIEDIQVRIDVNRAALEREARLTSASLRLAALGIFAGIATFAMLTFRITVALSSTA